MIRAKFSLFTTFILMLLISACSPAATATPFARPTSLPTQTQRVNPTPILTPTQPARWLPATESEVPRITPEDAKAAFDSGKAIIIDVRSPQAYEAKHIADAIFVSLSEIENNSPGLNLNKDQWIITYCT